MGLRELPALEPAARAKTVVDGGARLVPSPSGHGTYRGLTRPGAESCPCEDFRLRQKPGKRVVAARRVAERDGIRPAPPGDTSAAPKRKAYRQDWPKYDLPQTTGQDRFQELAYELCQGIEEPPRHQQAGKRIWRKDRVVAAADKVVSGFSGRRFMCDLRDAPERGCLAYVANPRTVADIADSDALTPVLCRLIERSARPPRAVATTFAPDGTGFGTSRFVKWYDEKYGRERSGRAWVEAHVTTGTKANALATARVDGPTAGDSPMFRPWLEPTVANGFVPAAPCADRAYLRHANSERATAPGAVPFIPFKSNGVPGEPGALWDRTFGYFPFHRADFRGRYRARSNVESTFGMVEAKFRDPVRSESDTALKNEVLRTFLCQNVVVVHRATVELGLDGTLGPEKAPDGDRTILKLGFRNQTSPARINV